MELSEALQDYRKSSPAAFQTTLKRRPSLQGAALLGKAAVPEHGITGGRGQLQPPDSRADSRDVSVSDNVY
jgi:hypothetical protein